MRFCEIRCVNLRGVDSVGEFAALIATIEITAAFDPDVTMSGDGVNEVDAVAVPLTTPLVAMTGLARLPWNRP